MNIEPRSVGRFLVTNIEGDSSHKIRVRGFLKESAHLCGKPHASIRGKELLLTIPVQVVGSGSRWFDFTVDVPTKVERVIFGKTTEVWPSNTINQIRSPDQEEAFLAAFNKMKGELSSIAAEDCWASVSESPTGFEVNIYHYGGNGELGIYQVSKDNKIVSESIRKLGPENQVTPPAIF